MVETKNPHPAYSEMGVLFVASPVVGAWVRVA